MKRRQQKCQIEENISVFLQLYEESEPPDVRGDHKQRTFIKNNSGSSRKKGRLTNNSFKSPLRLFINIILSLKGTRSLSQHVRSISKGKNLQTFPKLISLCQRQGIRKQITSIWSFQSQKYLNEKMMSTSVQKYEQILKWTNRMTQCLQLNSWPQIIQKYWGDKVRHKDKLNKCVEQIEKINNYEY